MELLEIVLKITSGSEYYQSPDYTKASSFEQLPIIDKNIVKWYNYFRNLLGDIMSVSLLAENSLLSFLSNPFIIVALILLIIGISMALLASKITATVRKTNQVAKNDKLLIILKTIGTIIICLGFVFFIIGAAILCGLF